MSSRVGIDVGGTFTDFVLTSSGSVWHHKEPSTPDDPSQAVASGLSTIVDTAGLSPSDLTGITHGTTIGLNTIIQRRGARIALVVTSGYRDILEIGRSRMPSSFDLHAAKEEPLVPRERIVEIDARLSPRGIGVPPSESTLDTVANAVRATGADAAAVVLLHGYTNPAFEADLTARLASRLPEIPLASAAAIWPEVREYERTLVACLNAYIQPLMRDYFDRLAGRLSEAGFTAPLYIAASNGGSLSLASAIDRPIETVLSGPASGVMAATRLARDAGVKRIVTFDMGGTSSDIAVAVQATPEFATHTTIGGLPLILPVVAVSAIGAGGGSIVWVDEQGVLKVGPASAGADPGPVAYGRGGVQPTVTDCYLVTGVIDPATFLGGRMSLDPDAARTALAGVASRLGSDSAESAAGDALRVATAGMATELQKTLAQRGLDPAEFTLVPFGGAGPTHAAVLAEEVGISHIVVPPTAATFCALGAVAADLRRDFARSLRRRLDPDTASALQQVISDLDAEARGWLADQGGGNPRVEISADLRYAGQAYELRIPLNDLTSAAVAAAFHAEHERLYGFADAHAPIEVGTARLAIVAPLEPVSFGAAAPGSGAPEPHGHRRVLIGQSWVDAAVFAREALGAGDSVTGPAVVEQDDTTVLIPPQWIAETDGAGNLQLHRKA